MHAQDLLINQSCNWEHVKASCELLPETNIESVLALLVESVYLGDVLTLMVAPKQEDALRVFDLVSE